MAHAFTEKVSSSNKKQSTSSTCTLYDESWAEDNSEESPEDSSGEDSLEGIINRSADVLPTLITLHGGNKDQTSASMVEASVPSNSSDIGTFEVKSISSQDPLRGRDGLPFDNLDWAMIEIADSGYHGMNGFSLGEPNQEWLYVKALRSSPPQGRIIVATRRGVVKGLGTGSTTSIKLSGSGSFRQVWSIQPDEALGMCFCVSLQTVMFEQYEAFQCRTRAASLIENLRFYYGSLRLTCISIKNKGTQALGSLILLLAVSTVPL